MTLNLTSEYYSTTRDFAIIDRDPADMAAIEAVFANDFAGRSIFARAGRARPHLEPGRGRPASKHHRLGQAYLYVENEEMSEYTIVDALCAAAGRGQVDVVMTYDSSWRYNFDKLAAAGVHVRTYAANASLVHPRQGDRGRPRVCRRAAGAGLAELLLGQPRVQPGVGLDLGPAHAGIVNSVAATVRSDFAGATPWPG